MFNKWKAFTREDWKIEKSEELMNGVEEITVLKGQQSELEASNAQLESENNELRAFSNDGYSIAQSAKEMADEKEKLLSQLREKNSKIKELLDARAMLETQLNALGKGDNTGRFGDAAAPYG